MVVDSKYRSSWRGWCSSEPVRAYRVCLWKNIMRGWWKFCGHTRFAVEDGSKIKLWHDLWCRDMTLNDAFSILFFVC